MGDIDGIKKAIGRLIGADGALTKGYEWAHSRMGDIGGARVCAQEPVHGQKGATAKEPVLVGIIRWHTARMEPLLKSRLLWVPSAGTWPFGG